VKETRNPEPMTNVFNPYDFTNPVTNMSVLADRNHEREEIDYYLDFALNAPRHINIALVGQRASGKTSLLNYIEFAALKKKFITYRIDLDEENVSSSYAFFFKIFDSLLSEAVKAGYLGGVTGKFLDVYREVTSTFNTTVDSEWTPFSFPMMYARVMSARTAELAPFPDNDFATDLDRLWKMGDRKFCLIFDECDLLGNSRGVLQKLRNIIQKSNGFMFVFAGTPKLFPVMDDVFSPIVRQFKKIEVRDFVEIDDIRECILNPLKLLDDRDPGDFFPLDNESLVREIHTLTSGRPYEVQLLCHSMFKRVQLRHSSQMSLDLAVMEDVQNELVSGQPLQSRPLIKTSKTLTRDELKQLRFFCISSEAVDLHQIVTFDNIMKGSNDAVEEEVRASQPYFEGLGLIECVGDRVQFLGDALDKIYIKYLAREKKVSMHFLDAPPEALLAILLTRELDREEGVSVFSNTPLSAPKAEEIISEWNTFVEKCETEEDPFLGATSSVQQIYFSMVEARSQKEVKLSRAEIALPWCKFSMVWFSRGQSTEEDPGRKFLQTRQAMIEAGNGTLVLENLNMRRVPLVHLVERLRRSANERLRGRIARQHERFMAQSYVDSRDVVEATMHAECLEKLNVALEPSGANNVGYLFLRLGKYELAVEKLKSAYNRTDAVENPESHLLSTYNLALAEAACGNGYDAKVLLDECIELGKVVPKFSRRASCLLQFNTSEVREVSFLESFDDPDIWHFAKEAREKLKELPFLVNPGD
jgi:hypothetical protein